MTGFLLGVTAAHERLWSRAGLVAPVTAIVTVAASAVVERIAEPTLAVDVTLAGVAFGVCLPLAAYAMVARACGNGRLDDAVLHLSRHGASRRSTLSGVVAWVALQVAALGAAIGLVAVTVAGGRLTSAFLSDALASAWIGVLAGAAYAAWLSFGSLFGKRGGGRRIGLFLDFAAGTGASAFAAPWPRAHVRSLVGGELLLGIPPWQSAAALVGLAAGYLLLCSLRVAR